MSFYPPKINARFISPRNNGIAAGANAAGMSASFQCGCFVRFSLHIHNKNQRVVSAKFTSNGCGHMIAAADIAAESLIGKSILELHGLGSVEMQRMVFDNLDTFPANRIQCSDVVFEAIKAAFSDYRLYRLEEFQSDKALICTCFGVSEEAIETCIAESQAETVGDVTDLCKAGGGCGSCQFLIQEMIDSHRLEHR